ncbi:hypothetical protein [Spirosoma daeguense]
MGGAKQRERNVLKNNVVVGFGRQAAWLDRRTFGSLVGFGRHENRRNGSLFGVGCDTRNAPVRKPEVS